MLLKDGEMRTRAYKNLEMLLEDGETRPLGCKNHMYPTPACALAKIIPETSVGLVSSNRERFAYYKHISYFFEIPCMY